MIVVIASLTGLLAWAALFLLPRSGLWRRAPFVAVGVGAVAVGLRAISDRTYDWFGSTDVSDVTVGLVLAAVAFATVRWGYPLADRWVPWLTGWADDLFALTHGAAPTAVALGAALMGTSEELLFRGVIQTEAGLTVSTLVYTAVQPLTRNPLVVGMGVLGGLVWGGLYALTGSLVPGLLCHVLPIAAIAVLPPPSADAPRAGQ